MQRDLIIFPSKKNFYSIKSFFYIETFFVFIISIPIMVMSPLLIDMYFYDKKEKRLRTNMADIFYDDNDYTNIILLTTICSVLITITYIAFKLLKFDISKVELLHSLKTIVITKSNLVSGKEQIINIPFDKLKISVQTIEKTITLNISSKDNKKITLCNKGLWEKDYNELFKLSNLLKDIANTPH